MGNEINPMFNKYLENEIIDNDPKLNELKTKLSNDKNADQIIAQIGLRLIELVETGKVSRESAMYRLCGFIFHKAVNNNKLLDSACGIACDLELPNRHVEGDISTKWNNLNELLRKIK